MITEGGLFKVGYNVELDRLLDLVEHGEQKLQAMLAEEQAKTGISRLKLGCNRVFGYYYEISRRGPQWAGPLPFYPPSESGQCGTLHHRRAERTGRGTALRGGKA